MSRSADKPAVLSLLNQASLILFALVLLVFGALSPAFFKADNFVNILIQTSSTGILAVGMTFVLLTAGVDLSVGSIMFVAAAIGGKLVLGGWSFGSSLAVMLGIGLIYGALNAVFITRLAIVAFIVTLATRYFGRGLGLRITETRAMNLPDSFYELGAARVLGVPAPVLIFAVSLFCRTSAWPAPPLDARSMPLVPTRKRPARRASTPALCCLQST